MIALNFEMRDHVANTHIVWRIERPKISKSHAAYFLGWQEVWLDGHPAGDSIQSWLEHSWAALCLPGLIAVWEGGGDGTHCAHACVRFYLLVQSRGGGAHGEEVEGSAWPDGSCHCRGGPKKGGGWGS